MYDIERDTLMRFVEMVTPISDSLIELGFLQVSKNRLILILALFSNSGMSLIGNKLVHPEVSISIFLVYVYFSIQS